MDIRRRFLSKKSSGGSSGGDSSGTYTVNLNGQWEKTTAVTNPDSSLYDGVYRSSSSYNVNSGVSIMYITLTGYSTFKLYIRSYAESNYDYVMVSQLDKTITGSSSYSDTSLVKAHTRGNQQSGTALSSYTLVEYTGISSGNHTITIVYRKDGSVNNGDDRGYVLIPKSQGDGGDVDVNVTYSILYTSSDGNIVTPYHTTQNWFGANITSNTYANGQGIITFDGPVTMIGEHAFYNCTSLTSITIPNSVASIGGYAFSSCSSLIRANIPDNVTSIGARAFSRCTSLTSVNIPNNVTSIGEYAFFNCSGMRAFYGKFTSSDNRCLIVDGVLNSFAPVGLTKYTIPNSVTSIGDSAFYYCKNLTSVTIPDSVTSIGEHAFYYCDNLTNIIIPNSVTSIGVNAFYFCTRMKNVTIGNSVTSIGSYAFCNCDGLTSIIIPDSVTEINGNAFQNCDYLTSVTMGNGVTSIGSRAFQSYYITSVYISDLSAWCKINFKDHDSNPLKYGVKLYINENVISDLVIPVDIMEIKDYAFNGCDSITKVTIHNKISSIGKEAFCDCSNLKEVYCKSAIPPVGGSDMFNDNASDRIIYVPTASVDAYKSAQYWSDYADYIVGYNF